MPIQSAQDLLTYELQAIKDAENQAAQCMQQIAKEAENSQLRRMVETRMKQGERILKDVERNLEKLEGGRGTVKNMSARGLIEDSEKLMKEVATPEMREAVAIAGLQNLEHYCIATWGTVKAMAGEVGEQQLSRAMQRAIDEGYKWDRKMTELAEKRINPAALEEKEEEC